MDVKEAIMAAKKYIAEIYEDEGIFNVGLEEVEFNADKWEVTIGFSRKWDRAPRNPFSTALPGQEQPRAVSRTYKIVDVNDSDGRVLAVHNRAGLL